MKNEIILFENQDVRLEVNMKDETVWLTQEQMSKLFGRDIGVISRHIKNIFIEELDEKSNLQKMQIANSDKPVNLYSLDVIIGVGYRVKSKQGIVFRQWATTILKEHLLRGYTVNQKRLEFLEKKVQLIDIASRIEHELSGDEAQEIIKVINNYSVALNLLDDYDHKSVSKPKGTKNSNKITYENCMDIICLLKFNSESNLFALERNKGLSSIINNIYQSFGGIDVYPETEEKAANFLYMIIKNHTFIDGNKRIAATLFIYFLEYYNLLFKDGVRVIDNNTLVAITLLIAQSNPKEKNIMIDLIMNFICSV